MHRQIMYPHDQHWAIYRQNPEHQYQKRVCIIVEVIIGARSLHLLATTNPGMAINRPTVSLASRNARAQVAS